MAGSVACIHLLACAWHYLGNQHADWQHDGETISWLHVEESLSSITYGRSLWGMSLTATAWERCELSALNNFQNSDDHIRDQCTCANFTSANLS